MLLSVPDVSGSDVEGREGSGLGVTGRAVLELEDVGLDAAGGELVYCFGTDGWAGVCWGLFF